MLECSVIHPEQRQEVTGTLRIVEHRFSNMNTNAIVFVFDFEQRRIFDSKSSSRFLGFMKDLQNKFEFLSGTGLKQNEKNKKV
jgi:hypothetical protein